MDFIKKNFAIILAFLLPVLLIVGVALSSYLPSILLSTDYDFVYTTCSDGIKFDHGCNNYLKSRYTVVDGSLVEAPISSIQDSDRDKIPDIEENYQNRIFLHDTEKNQSREITLKEAKNLRLSDLITSPDGVSVTNDYQRGSNGFFFFGGGYSDYGYYLTRGNARQKLNLINISDNYYQSNDFTFIGWVIENN